MTKLLRLTSAALLTLCLCLAARSYPTLFGETGLVQAPTSDVVPLYELEFSANFATVNIADENINVYPLRLTYGVGPRTEMFFMFSEAKGTGQNMNVLGAGGKLQIIKESVQKRSPGLAAGVRVYRIKQGIDINTVEAYAVFSKALFAQGDLIDEGFTLRLHAGAMYTRLAGDISDTSIGLFGGLSYRNLDGTTLVFDVTPAVESDGLTVRESSFSAAYRRPLGDSLWAEIGTTRPFTSKDSTLYAGLVYHMPIADDNTGENTGEILY